MKAPTAAELQHWGLTREEASSHALFDVWPDNWSSTLVFADLSTQWRSGFNGPIGLDYSAIPFVLRMKRIARDKWPEIFEDIVVMEDETLKFFRDK